LSQAKVANLDSRITKVTDDIKLTREKLSVLLLNAEKVNPVNVVKTTDTVR